jgi:hypothetical protein
MAHRQRIMIVGNGGIAQASAARIDASDLVIRFNDVQSFGGNGGTRTDVVAVCNTGRPAAAMLTSEDWMRSSPVQTCSEIWCVRDPGKFAALRDPLRLTHPALDDFCDDYTSGFSALAADAGKLFYVIPTAVHDRLDHELDAHEAGHYVSPSSGIMVIAHVLSADRFSGWDVEIAGFGHAGWEHHPFEAERRLVDAWVKQGRLVRMDDETLGSSDGSGGEQR